MKPAALFNRLRILEPTTTLRRLGKTAPVRRLDSLRAHAPSLPGWVPLAALAGALAIISVIVVPTLSTQGDTTDAKLQVLGKGNLPKRAISDGTVSSNLDGYVIDDHSYGRVSIPLEFSTKRGQRSILRLWANGKPKLETEVTIIGPDQRRKKLGRATSWVGKPFDVTDVVRHGQAHIEVTSDNSSLAPALFFDQAAAAFAPESAVTDSRSGLVALWMALLVAAVLQLRRLLARHWFLAGAAGLLVLLLWPKVLDQTLMPLDGAAAALWEAARSAKTFSLHSGLISGSFGELSALGAQAYHVMTLLVGEGGASARAASALASVAALCALYALGNRVAGRLGAITVTVMALLADPFRDAATSGSALPVLILAAALFAYGIHVCLAEASRYAVGILGACGALAFLADPTWLFGILLAIAILTFQYGPRGDRWRVAGVGALILFVLILPNRISTADQAGGNLFADMTKRATFARNVEFAGEGHGAPSKQRLAGDPFGGRGIGLVPYLLDEHSPIVFVGGALSGANDALGEFGGREETRLFGLVAFVLGILGSAYLLIIPRLRLMILLPLSLAMPALFLASKEAGTPFAAGTAVWPSFLLGGGVLAYGARKLASERHEGTTHPTFGVHSQAAGEPAIQNTTAPRGASEPL